MFFNLSRNLLKGASSALVGGGASLLGLGTLTRVFNETERIARQKEFDQITRGRWHPETRKTENGISFPTCPFTTDLYHFDTIVEPTMATMTQHEVTTNAFSR